MEFHEKDWIPEVEMKCDGVSVSDLKRGLRRLEKLGARIEPVFSGIVHTHWFNRKLEGGTSARVRIATWEDGKVDFTATIKRPSPHESSGKTVHVKTKLENNRSANSYEDAFEILIEGVRSIGMIRPGADLVKDFTSTKHRTSFNVFPPGEELLRTDADRFISFNPNPVKYPEERLLRRKHRLVELEAVDGATAPEKEKRLLLKAAQMKFPPVDPRFAPLNTRTYHKEKGEY